MTNRVDNSSDSSNPNRRNPFVLKLLDFQTPFTPYLKHLLHLQAFSAQGTEAAVFILGKTGAEFLFQDVVHMRPDDHDEKERKAAVEVLRGFAYTCIRECRDGVILTNPDPDGEGRYVYCLVTRLFANAAATGACCIITHCRGDKDAKDRLVVAQAIAAFFDLYSSVNRNWWS